MKFGLIVTRFPYGGAEKQAKAFADFLHKKGHKAEIIALENTDSFKTGNIEVAGLGLEPVGFSFGRIFKFLKYLFSLRSAIKDNYDIVITYPQNYFLGLIAGKNTTKIISVRIFYPNSIRYLRKKLLMHFDLIITNNLPQYSLLHAVKANSILMNNRVENGERKERVIRDNKQYLMVANIKRRKNLEVPINVFGALADQGYKLYIAGRIEDEKYFSELDKKVKQSENIQYLGFKSPDELKEIYQSVEGIVHSSKREGAANVILEAMAQGLPAIVYRIPENISLIENKKEFLFENESELKERVISLHHAIHDKEAWLHNYLSMQQEKTMQAYHGNDYALILEKIERLRKLKTSGKSDK